MKIQNTQTSTYNINISPKQEKNKRGSRHYCITKKKKWLPTIIS